MSKHNGCNSNICCNVENCVYNRDAHSCTAESIDVERTCANPDCCDETECRTFKPRS